jgi:hypothetical protein
MDVPWPNRVTHHNHPACELRVSEELLSEGVVRLPTSDDDDTHTGERLEHSM